MQILSTNWGFDYVGRRRRIGPIQRHPANKDVRIFQALVDNRVAGSVIVDVFTTQDVFVMDVFVRKSFRFQGVCNKLLRHIKKTWPTSELHATAVNPIIARKLKELNA